MELGLFILITAAFVAWVYQPRWAEWSPMTDPFSQWCEYAADRRTIMLMNGNEATLLAVHKGPRSCRIQYKNRHYNCWVEDIACVKLENGWVVPPLWKAVDLDTRPGTTVRSHRAPKSKRWLNVEPDYTKLHPSFHPKTPTD